MSFHQMRTIQRVSRDHRYARKTQLQQFKKDVSNNATQDSIMNLHNKTQLTHARINCKLKDSSCDTPLSEILKLTILASNASSNSTMVFKYPHTKNYSIFTQWFNHSKFWNQMQRSLSQRRTQYMLSPIGFPVFSNQQLFQLTQDQKGIFKGCNGAECKGLKQYSIWLGYDQVRVDDTRKGQVVFDNNRREMNKESCIGKDTYSFEGHSLCTQTKEDPREISSPVPH
ncbi:hypothetical protein H5410_041120 [Solanum commersonii]|uniref:Uncharacterized protein n=1 Tax=Solanum commersonii TaxID=4109 RepID=A0A9J5XUJ2_SOLCO|nr:hypothetical protein H5410_041120 [Solanum commersonii]